MLRSVFISVSGPIAQRLEALRPMDPLLMMSYRFVRVQLRITVQYGYRTVRVIGQEPIMVPGPSDLRRVKHDARHHHKSSEPVHSGLR